MTRVQPTSCNIRPSSKYFTDYADGLYHGIQGWQHKK